MYATGRRAAEIVDAEGLGRIDDEAAIDRIVRRGARRARRPGGASTAPARRKTFGFLVGQVMKATAGKANPARVNESVRRVLGVRTGSRRDRSAERLEDVQPRRVRAARPVAAHRQGRVRLPHRAERRRQVDAAAPAAAAGRPDRRAARRRRPRPRDAVAAPGPGLPPLARLRLPGLQAAARTRPCSRTSRSCRACSAWRRRSSSAARSRS